MPIFEQLFQAGSGSGAMPVWLAGALAALAVFAAVTAFGRAAQAGRAGMAWRAVLLLAGAGLTYAVVGAASGRDQAAAHRALEMRAAELSMRAMAPGSPLACLETVANPTVEEACEKILFASADAVAAAVAYTDARISLLAESVALSPGDRKAAERIERWRQPIESDRFGLVAHVLVTRGCSADRCEELKLLRDPQRVLVNLRERSFEAQVVLHSATWRSDSRARPAPEAPAPQVASPPAVAKAPSVSTTGTASTPIDYPTAASIPAISIMNAEPPLSQAEAQALGSAPPAVKPPAPVAQPQPAERTQPAQPRRQSARDNAAPLPPPGTQPSQQPQASAPVQIAPPAASNIPRWGGGN